MLDHQTSLMNERPTSTNLHVLNSGSPALPLAHTITETKWDLSKQKWAYTKTKRCHWTRFTIWGSCSNQSCSTTYRESVGRPCYSGYHPLDSAIYSTISAALSSTHTLLNWFSLYSIQNGLTTTLFVMNSKVQPNQAAGIVHHSGTHDWFHVGLWLCSHAPWNECIAAGHP